MQSITDTKYDLFDKTNEQAIAAKQRVSVGLVQFFIVLIIVFIVHSSSRSSLELAFLQLRRSNMVSPNIPMDDLTLGHIPGIRLSLLFLQCQIFHFPILLPLLQSNSRTTCQHHPLADPSNARIRITAAGHLFPPAASRRS